MNISTTRPRKMMLMMVGAFMGLAAGFASAQAGFVGPATDVPLARGDTARPVAQAGYYGHGRYRHHRRARPHRVWRRVCHRHRRLVRVWHRGHQHWHKRWVRGPRHCHRRLVWAY